MAGTGIVLGVLGAALLGAYFGGAFASSLEPAMAPDSGAEEGLLPVNHTLALDPVVIQLGDADGKSRYVRLGITLGIHRAHPEIPLRIDKQTPFVPRFQDRLILVVGQLTSRQLASTQYRETLKQTLLQEAINQFPEEQGQVLELYLTELLIQ